MNSIICPSATVNGCCFHRCVVTNDGLSSELQVWELAGGDSGEFTPVDTCPSLSSEVISFFVKSRLLGTVSVLGSPADVILWCSG